VTVSQTERLIATVTLNPAVDQSVSVERLALGGTNRCRLESLDPGGKGINASRVAHRLGRPTLALGFAGGVTGGLLRARLDGEGVPHDLAEVGAPTRLNVVVHETASRRRTRLYMPGARVEAGRLAWLRDRLAALPPGGVVVVAGSLPPGLPAETYRDLVLWLRRRGQRTVVDAQGAALAAALDGCPTLVKPNAEEAAELLGRPLPDDRALLDAAWEIKERGAEHVVISQGERGAVALGPEGAWRATPPRVEARSAVGSGDSMVAGLAVGLLEGMALPEALRLGTAAGAATALTPGTQLCWPADVARLLHGVVLASLEAGSPAAPAAALRDCLLVGLPATAAAPARPAA
jgi:1-phosphofructokinase family hexose kinase